MRGEGKTTLPASSKLCGGPPNPKIPNNQVLVAWQCSRLLCFIIFLKTSTPRKDASISRHVFYQIGFGLYKNKGKEKKISKKVKGKETTFLPSTFPRLGQRKRGKFVYKRFSFCFFFLPNFCKNQTKEKPYTCGFLFLSSTLPQPNTNLLSGLWTHQRPKWHASQHASIVFRQSSFQMCLGPIIKCLISLFL